ncbi:High-affinity branched-chain amino acid transport system permease protein LivH [Euzebya pacifica]|uniref:High-affinity branched-chain amino acid transport system permease protein LivH n=1 Tax=Euzebya pacifica TaxID=1608957 RepID=A0A346XYV5_9ACTN|nr:branched-chain amino acid ABC transporter permease [Euzebya pacifica]AXV07402.1 High-affinity branched-chain amino acid transport system permease protein LivH [Euzebya pacifica]
MTQFAQAIVSGLGQGSIYALVALGFVIIYKSTRVISFAQPALMITGSLFVAFLHDVIGFWPALLVAVVGTAAVAMTVERTTLRPMIGQPPFVVAIITIGVDIVLRVVQNRLIGTNLRFVGDPWGLQNFQLGELLINQRDVARLFTTLLILAMLSAFFRYSRFGLGMRAAAFDQETALAQGIDVGRVFMVSWALAGALAAVAGMFVDGGGGISQQTWIVALKALPAIIIGGLDSVNGAVIGGLAVGIVEALVASYQTEYFPWMGNGFAAVSPYVLLLLVLLVRPYGLFGTPEVERV